MSQEQKEEKSQEKPREDRKSSKFWKVVVILVLLISAGVVLNYWSSTPMGQQAFGPNSPWANYWQSVVPPTPQVATGLLHPALASDNSFYFFTTTAPNIGQYALVEGDQLYGNTMTVIAYNPFSTNSTTLQFESFTPVQVTIKDPKTNATYTETQYNLNNTQKMTVSQGAIFQSETIAIPPTSVEQLVKVYYQGSELFYFYHRTYASFLVVPPSTQGALFNQTEEYVIGSVAISGIALLASVAVAKRRGYVPRMGKWGWFGAIGLIGATIGAIEVYQLDLSLASIPYTYLPLFTAFFFISLQLIRPDTLAFLFLKVNKGDIRASVYFRSLEIVPSSIESKDDGPIVADGSWRVYITGKRVPIHFLKSKRKLDADGEELEDEEIPMISNEYWNFEVSNNASYKLFMVADEIRLLEVDGERFYEIIISEKHSMDELEFLSDLKTVNTLAQQNMEYSVRNRYLRNNLFYGANKIASRFLQRILGSSPERIIANSTDFNEAIQAGRSKKDIIKDVDSADTVGKTGPIAKEVPTE